MGKRAQKEDTLPDTVLVEILPTTKVHIRELMDNLRKKDKEEIESYGFTHKRGVWRSYRLGLRNMTALFDGQVAACWGVAGTYMGSVGHPWLLTTEKIYEVSPRFFAREYKREVQEMLKLFPLLVNYVSADYNEAIRFLKICGFTVGEAEKLGKGMFCKFQLEVK